MTTPLHFVQVEEEPPSSPVAVPSVDAKDLAQAKRSARFALEIQDLNMRNARLGAWFVMILVPFCSVLDWLAYPLRFWEFLVLRLACSLLCVPLLLALDRPWAARYHRVYPVILPLIPAIAICVMLFLVSTWLLLQLVLMYRMSLVTTSSYIGGQGNIGVFRFHRCHLLCKK